MGKPRASTETQSAFDAARAALAICRAVDRGDVEGFVSLIEAAGGTSWLRVFTDDGDGTAALAMSATPMGLTGGEDGQLHWAGIAEQAIVLLRDASQALAEVRGVAVELLYERWAERLVEEEARRLGHNSLVVTCLSQHLAAGMDTRAAEGGEDREDR